MTLRVEKEGCPNLLWYNHNLSNLVVNRIMLGTSSISKKYNPSQALAYPTFFPNFDPEIQENEKAMR